MQETLVQNEVVEELKEGIRRERVGNTFFYFCADGSVYTRKINECKDKKKNDKTLQKYMRQKTRGKTKYFWEGEGGSIITIGPMQKDTSLSKEEGIEAYNNGIEQWRAEDGGE